MRHRDTTVRHCGAFRLQCATQRLNFVMSLTCYTVTYQDVVLVLKKLGGQYKKERKINFRTLLPGNCLIRRTRTGHLPWRTEFNHRRANVSIVLGKVTMGNSFVQVLLFILFNTNPSVFNTHSYIPEVM